MSSRTSNEESAAERHRASRSANLKSPAAAAARPSAEEESSRDLASSASMTGRSSPGGTGESASWLGVPTMPSRRNSRAASRSDKEGQPPTSASTTSPKAGETASAGPSDDKPASPPKVSSVTGSPATNARRIEGWYNPVRLHSGLGYRSPMTYEPEREPALTEPWPASRPRERGNLRSRPSTWWNLGLG